MTWHPHAYIADVVALLRSYRPSLSAAQVVRRIELTASGKQDARLGYGLVNAYAAVTAEGIDGAASPSPAVPQRVEPARAASLAGRDQTAAVVAIVGPVLALALALGTALVRHGRARALAGTGQPS